MLKLKLLAVAATSFMLLGAAGSANAATQHYKMQYNVRHKSGDEAYKAQGADVKMWPGVPGMAAPEPLQPDSPVYTAPRGGREY